MKLRPAASWSFHGLALHPFGPVSAQLYGHAVNFLTQALLYAVRGGQTYAELGLALTAVATLLFLGELGVPTLFLRESSAGPAGGWVRDWRVAAGWRLAFQLVALPCLLLAWYHAAGAQQGFAFLLGAAPGLLLGALNPQPVLYGQGRTFEAALGQQLRWTVHGLSYVALALWAPPALLGIGTGLAYAVALVVQLAWYRWRATPAAWFIPARGAFPRASLSLWAVGALGVLHGRALPFLLQSLTPSLVAPTLLLLQVSNGLATAISQFDRFVLPRWAAARGSTDWAALLRSGLRLFAIAAVAVVLPATILLAAAPGLPAIVRWFGALLLFEWLLQVAAHVATLLQIARRDERYFLRSLALLQAAGLAGQLLAWSAGSIWFAFAARLAVPAAALALLLSRHGWARLLAGDR